MSAFKENNGLFQKPKPPVVGQKDADGTFRMRCWAAALSSWLSAARGLNWTMDDVIKMFKTLLASNDGLPFENFKQVAENLMVQMNYDIITPEDLSEDYLVRMLRRSHLYIVMAGNQGVSHAMVVHGVSRRGEKPFIWGMDPMQNSYTVGPLSDFAAFGQKFLVGYAKILVGRDTHPIWG
jgi:Papain-like cysteine protease AvrRpt2